LSRESIEASIQTPVGPHKFTHSKRGKNGKFIEKIFFSPKEISYWSQLRYEISIHGDDSDLANHIKWIETQADKLEHNETCNFCKKNLATQVSFCYNIDKFFCDDCEGLVGLKLNQKLALKYSSISSLEILADKKRFKERLNKIFGMSARQNQDKIFAKLLSAGVKSKEIVPKNNRSIKQLCLF